MAGEQDASSAQGKTGSAAGCIDIIDSSIDVPDMRGH